MVTDSTYKAVSQQNHFLYKLSQTYCSNKKLFNDDLNQGQDKNFSHFVKIKMMVLSGFL